MFFLVDHIYKLVMSPAENLMGSDEEDGCREDETPSSTVDGMFQ